MDKYNDVVSLSRKEEVLRDELRRVRSTASFQFGYHFVQAFQRPWRLLLLPITVPLLLMRIARRGYEPPTPPERYIRDCVVVFSSESMRGLHFDRCEALLETMNGADTQLIHVSTDGHGYKTSTGDVVRFSLPSRRYSESMNPKVWNRQCEVFLNCILDIYAPKTFIFDGDYPFRGLLNAIELREEMNRYWIRESPHNQNITKLPIDGFEIFDAVLHPSLTKTNDPDTNVGSSGTVFCNPIVPKKPEDAFISTIREKMNVKTSQLIFFDLGPSHSKADDIARQLLLHPNVTLLVREHLKSNFILNHERTRITHGLSYADAVHIADAVVIFPDQFSVHVALMAAKPVLSLHGPSPTKRAISEDLLEGELPLLFIEDHLDERLVTAAVQRLLDQDVQQQLIERIQGMNLIYDSPKLANFLFEYHH